MKARKKDEPVGRTVLPAKSRFLMERFVRTKDGEVEHKLNLSLEAISKLPQHKHRVKGYDGVEATYEGVMLHEILRGASVPLGDQWKGQALATYLVVEPADGYRAVFSLPEVDPASSNQLIFLAVTRDRKPLDIKEGPLHVTIPNEKHHAHWVRQGIRFKIAHA